MNLHSSIRNTVHFMSEFYGNTQILSALKSAYTIRTILILVLFNGLVLFGFSQPTISSFTPTSGDVGTSVTITGTGFNTTPANNAVYFGSVLATVNTASATNLSVTVPTRSTYEPITVINTATNLACKSGLSFQVTNSLISGTTVSASSFSDAVSITTVENDAAVLGGTAAGDAITVADFDNDGKPDVAKVAYSTSSNVVNVQRNIQTSEGTISASSFSDAGDFAIAGDGYTIRSADFDGDGKLDIVAVCGATASFLRNTSSVGTISFASKVDLTINTSSTMHVADIDGDGKIDIVVGSSYTSTYYVYLNTSTSGTISFSTSATSVSSGTSGGRHFTIGDLNNDGKADLIMPGTTLMIKINISTSGSVSFDTEVDLSVGYGWYCTVGDLSGNGKNDIIAMLSSESILVNSYSSGSFASGDMTTYTSIASNSGYAWSGMGDFNGDGKLDYCVGAQNSGHYVYFRKSNYTSGSFSSASFDSYLKSTGVNSPRQVILCDIDGDDKLDIVASGSSNTYFQVFQNDIADDGLPISLLGFDIALHPNKLAAVIDWETAAEINNDHFTIERSYDGQNWEELTKVMGNGNSSNQISYRFIDDNPIIGRSYYRLVQTDYDGTIHTFAPKFFMIDNVVSTIKLYPNPAEDIITVEGNTNELSVLRMYNILGVDVTANVVLTSNSNNKMQLDISNLASGVYFVKTDLQTLKFTMK